MEKATVINSILHLFPIKKRKIMFMSHWGNRYNCNPKYLSEYMVEHCPDWDIVWAFANPEKYEIKGVRVVRFPSIRYFYELATCRVFVTNLRMLKHFQKRKGQFYVQTWHAPLAIKMIEEDAEDTLPSNYIKMAKRDSSQMDVLLSGCQKNTDIFRNCFWFKGPIIPSGTPRQDIMFEDNINLKEHIKKILSIENNEKILLYAPTFRKDGTLEHYNLDFNVLSTTLQQKFGGKWKILLRLHPNIAYLSSKLSKGLPNVKDVSLYDDIQELLLIADVVISDYSSLVFDYAVTKRPCFLYTPDLYSYTHSDRGLYFEIQTLPFPYSNSPKELYESILSFTDSKYKKDVESFWNSIGSFDDGHACERVINFINNNCCQ